MNWRKHETNDANARCRDRCDGNGRAASRRHPGEYDPYISNWTSPYLYVLPENVGNLTAGTLLLASVVTGDDHFYLENKAANPDWVPDNDGDRSDT